MSLHSTVSSLTMLNEALTVDGDDKLEPAGKRRGGERDREGAIGEREIGRETLRQGRERQLRLTAHYKYLYISVVFYNKLCFTSVNYLYSIAFVHPWY